MRKIMLFIGLIALFYSCDPVDDKLKIVNSHKDSILISSVLTKDHYFSNLFNWEEQYKAGDFESRFLMIGDTISMYTMGDWDNQFSGLNDSLFIFATKQQDLIDYFEGAREQANVYELFVITYKELLENEWIITIPINND